MATNGIKTSFWGPPAWNFLFSAIAGTYPIKFDADNKIHQKKMRGFVQMFSSLKETLPCIYCRQSYAKLLKELPIKDYIHSRLSMMKWLYLIHDRVNQKLMKYEQSCFISKREILREQLQSKKITLSKYNQSLAKLKTILITKPSPKLELVIARYEKQRA